LTADDAPTTLLLIEDNPGDARLLREMVVELGAPNISLVHVASLAEAEKYVAHTAVDVILLDLGLPDAQGLDAVRRALAAAPGVPLLVLTGLDDESLALQTLQEGAQDYLVKGRIEALGLFRALRYGIERKSLEEALFAEKDRAQVTLNCIGDAIVCTDVSGLITFQNHAAETMTGWLKQQAIGRPVASIFRLVDAGARSTVPIPTATDLAHYITLQPPANCILVRRDGSEIPVEDSVAPIRDRNGNSAGTVVVFRDVSAAREMSAQMNHSAQHDFLTGLPNRMLLNDRVDQAIVMARRHQKHVAVLFLDLDRFKHINDSLGHPVGDQLLQSVAKRLVTCARASDTVSRQGGDEFVVLLSEVEQVEDAALAARRMLAAVAEVHSFDQLELNVTSSIGVSMYADQER